MREDDGAAATPMTGRETGRAAPERRDPRCAVSRGAALDRDSAPRLPLVVLATPCSLCLPSGSRYASECGDLNHPKSADIGLKLFQCNALPISINAHPSGGGRSPLRGVLPHIGASPGALTGCSPSVLSSMIELGARHESGRKVGSRDGYSRHEEPLGWWCSW